jgi:MoaA/NifB/PqqE/SkfB family radical SAM enzyme
MGRFDPRIDTDPTKDWVPTEVYNWDRKETNVLVLNYTMACPLACDFCCYGCHSGRAAEKMPLDLALSLVKQAAELKLFSSVGFTGGEAMLFYEELLVIGDTLVELGLPFTIATACHWAVEAQATEEIIEQLASRGLRRINISHDPSHAKFVPKSSVINAALATSRKEIPTYIVGTFFTAQEKLEDYIPELANVPYVKLINKYVSQVGRAKHNDITQETYGLNLELDDLFCYRRTYHDIVIFWDGKAYPCCSTFNRATRGITLGNAFEDSLLDLYRKAEGSLKFRIMKRQGLGKLYRIIEEYNPELFEELPEVDSSAGPCSLCNKLFSKREMTEKINKTFESYERDSITGTLSAVVNLIGEEKTGELIKDLF